MMAIAIVEFKCRIFMTEDKLDQKRQKTLGLSTKKLGVKLPAAKLPVRNSIASKNKRTVLVITKTKSTKDASQNKDNSQLTSQERESRLSALLQAEKSGALADLKEKVTDSTPDIENSNLHNTTPEVGIDNNNKINNLDCIDKKETSQITGRTKEDTGEATKFPDRRKEDAKKSIKTQKVIDDEEQKINKKKKILDTTKDLKKVSLTQVFKLEQDDDVIKTKIRTIKRVSKNRHRDIKGQKQEKIYREVKIPDQISVQELASRMTEKVTLLIKTLMGFGVTATANQYIDADTAELVVQELGHTPIRVTDAEIEKSFLQEEESGSLEPRTPVVTIMGHVDHGKTSLLDALRSTDVVKEEHGGITQHIGAYKISLSQGHSITFLDTPGHEAFTAMRMRGAKITDIVVIVVAADDGIKEQTIEAINHAKVAEVPIIVAINKIDKPEANVNRVKNSLSAHGLIPEDIGGEVMVIPVSAQEKKGLVALEEAILIQAEMLDLKANRTGRVDGVVIESKVDKMKGVLATLLVQRGTLKIGDITVIRDRYFKVRVLIDDKGNKVTAAIPSTPVEILGIDQAPEAGEKFVVVENEKLAKKIVEFQAYKKNKSINENVNKPSFDILLKNQANTNLKTLSIILKADVHGSLEAITATLQRLSNEEVKIKIVHSAVGGIIESDISLAKVTNAIVLGFNIKADNKTKRTASSLGIEIRYYSIIYDLIDDIKALISGLASPVQKEKIIGYAEIREVINLTKHGKVAGCMVTEGVIKKKAYVRLLRDNVVIHNGKLLSLKRFKDDVKEVKSGFECGISLENFTDIKVNDRFEVYEIVEEEKV